MDSITQAVLGAAMGEAVAGKKMGNKALLWGAFAGTLPDFDVFSRLFVSHPVDGLIYHRGLTHSILFTLLAPLLLAWLSHTYYEKKWNQSLGARIASSLILGGLILGISAGLGFLSFSFPSQYWLFLLLGLSLWASFLSVKNLIQDFKNRNHLQVNNISYFQWVQLFFWSILTHWLIDACTAYGTQIFEPFSSYRVAFNNIFIFDPLYTIPLLIGCTGALWSRSTSKRQFWNWLGIGLSSLYMAWSFYAKSLANQAVKDSLLAQNIAYEDFLTYPSVGNTILWQTSVRAADAYYYGTYSLLDENPQVQFIRLPSNHELLDKYKDQHYVKILTWFAQDYYNILPLDSGQLQFNNLRFGLLGETQEGEEPDYTFKYILGLFDNQFDARQKRDLPNDKLKRDFAALWERLKGNKATH